MNDITSIITQLEQQRVAIDKALEALRGITDMTTSADRGTTSTGRKKRTVSPEARQRMAEAQRARWASKKANKTAGPKKIAKKASKKATKKTSGAAA